MRKAALVYNPASGTKRERRLADVEAVARVLRAAGVEAVLVATSTAGSAGEQAKQAIAGGCDAVLACGGDGTVHEVLQGMVESAGEVPLGVIPLGTGNALATDLGLPRDPASAARTALESQPRRIAAGKIEYQNGSGRTLARYFTVLAGVGADAEMLYAMRLDLKKTAGMNAYYAEAFRLYWTHRFVPFEIELEEGGRREVVWQVLASRISHFGGILRELAPGAALERDDLLLILFKTSSRWAYSLYTLRGLLGRRWKVPGVELVHARAAICRPLAHADGEPRRVYAEADGELLGGMPLRITVVPNAFRLLMPPWRAKAWGDGRASQQVK